MRLFTEEVMPRLSHRLSERRPELVFDLYERALLMGLTLQNRIVMAPMSRARAEDEARVPNALMKPIIVNVDRLVW